MVAPFYFLMPVWGETYVGYLLKLGLATLMSPGNIPALPNLGVSKFIFLTTEIDAERIKKSNLYADLAGLVSVEWEFLEFYEGTLLEHYDLLKEALQVGVKKAAGKGFCLFLHPDGLYSDGMMRRLYQLAEIGKKAVVSIGPNVTTETTVPYMEKRGLVSSGAAVKIPPRQMVKILEDNFHADMKIQFWNNECFPKDPYLAIWEGPGGGGYLFRYLSLHPWLVDLRDRKDTVEFGAVDHDFVRAHGFLWRDIHVETDSDNFIVLGLKREEDRYIDPRQRLNHDRSATIGKMVFQPANCSYSRFYFMNGIWAHTNGIPEEWVDFEKQNLLEVNERIEREIAYLQMPGIQKALYDLRPIPARIIGWFKKPSGPLSRARAFLRTASSWVCDYLKYLNIFSFVRFLNHLITLAVPKPIRRGLRKSGRAIINALPDGMAGLINKFLARVLTRTVAKSD